MFRTFCYRCTVLLFDEIRMIQRVVSLLSSGFFRERKRLFLINELARTVDANMFVCKNMYRELSTKSSAMFGMV